MGFALVVIGVTLTMLVGGSASLAEAHGVVGKRFLPATLAIDDPFVADELSLPTLRQIKHPGSGEKPATRETDVSAEFSKRLGPNLGLSLGGTWKHLDPLNATSVSGFDNMDVAVKYVLLRSDEHEALFSVGLGWDVGGTGSKKKVDAERFDTVTPGFFFGKGFGDLPEALDYAKPLALTGIFGVGVPTRHATKTGKINDDTGAFAFEREVNGSTARWGVTVQYSVPYLQSFVRDIGLPKPFSRMIPLVEFSMQTSLDDPKNAGRTTGTVNPGIIWFGRFVQIGIEAIVPINERSGKNIGVMGQLHFFLDDIMPQIFSWTPFHGVLGPAVPRP